MKLLKSLVLVSLVCALMFTGCSGSSPEESTNEANAEIQFPNENIRFIIPNGAGGANDLTARSLIPGMERVLGVTIVPENLTEGAGAAAAVELQESEADGQTIYFNSQTLIIANVSGIEAIQPDQFQPLSVVVEDTSAITVKADAPWNTLQEFVDYAKDNPGEVTIATNGAGALWHLAAVKFANAAGIELQYIPYPSGGAAMATALAGGEIDATCNSPTEVKPLVDAGEIKILAVQSEERHPMFPDVPTLKELGIDTSFPVWRGIFCKAGTDEAIIQKLDEAVKSAWDGEEFKTYTSCSGLPAKFRDHKDFENLFESEKQAYADLWKQLDM